MYSKTASPTLPQQVNNGWLNGFIGVLIFSGSMPATKAAIMDFDPVYVTGARACIAGVLALMTLVSLKEQFPQRAHLPGLIIVALGVVVGFPLLSALALQYMTSAHSLVFVGILPLATAIFGVIRGGERPRAPFWIFSILGSVLVIAYALAQGIEISPIGDLLLFLAIVLCGLGYAEGARLSKSLGGWQVISWALVFSLPVMLPLIFIWSPPVYSAISISAWVGLLYVSLFSMFIGFIFWYRGLAQGGIAAVGQLQLLQPFFGLAIAATMLHEHVSLGMLGVTIGIILCVMGSKKFATK